LAKSEGQAKFEQWRAKPESGQWQAPVTISREQTQQLPANLVDVAMRVDEKKLPLVESVNLGVKGFGVVKINKVVPASEAVSSPESIERFTKAWATAENLAYFSLLKDRLKVVIKAPEPVGNGLGR
jgi:peptidyl-prolyl cis-trans isomerase D